MRALTSKRLLQAVVAVLGLVPLAAGAAGILLGPGLVLADTPWPVDLDSHFRFLSGIFLALGLLFYATIPAIERRTTLFRLGTALVFVGGLARLLSLRQIGAPGWPHVVGLVLELVVVPALAVWQTVVARSMSAYKG